MRRVVALLLAAVLLLGTMTACGSEKKETDFQLWFVRTADDGAVSLSTESYSGVQTIPAVMNALLDGPSGMNGLTSLIPEGTELQSWEQTGAVIHVDLSQPYSSLVGVNLTLADYCIVLTLCQLEGIRGVRITVNGIDLPSRGRQILWQADVVLSGAEEEPVELIAALCFRRTGGNELGVEQRMFRLTESQSATLAVLQALLAGPKEAGMQTLLPEGTEVYSARVEAGVCYADFSQKLIESIPGSMEEQQLIIRSIVESLCSLGYVQAVQILVEGEPLSHYGQLDVSQPLS